MVAIDAGFVDEEWRVFINGGRKATNLKVLDWGIQVQNLGAGEILLTSMQNDGTKNGFAIELTRQLTDLLSIPVIASGGAGVEEHFTEVFEETGATGALAASIFHFGEIPIPQLKKYLKEEDIEVRL